MNLIDHPNIHQGNPLPRDLFLKLVTTALKVGEIRYAKRITLAWLAAFPGDLKVVELYGYALLKDENPRSKIQALSILEDLCQVDPEYANAQELLAEARRINLASGVDEAVINAQILSWTDTQSDQQEKKTMPSDWSARLLSVRLELGGDNSKSVIDQKANLSHAVEQIHQVLLDNADSLLAAVTHLRIMIKKGDIPTASISDLAQVYHDRWPKCLQFLLILADTLMCTGESEKAVALLHQAVVNDVTGQVPERLWGVNHSYRSLWPDRLEITAQGLTAPQNIPIPANVSSEMGWNLLPQGSLNLPIEQQPTTKPTVIEYSLTNDESLFPTPQSHNSPPARPRVTAPVVPETLRSVQDELDHLAVTLKQPRLARIDGRFPVYVAFTTRNGLNTQYGVQATDKLLEEIKVMLQSIRGRHLKGETWGAILFCPDDPKNSSAFSLKPVPHNDPWALKLSLIDLDEYLGKRGEMIGAILIIGGPSVVPFHHLPNPVDDMDVDVPSDNPYATRDDNYFIPEWPVGRLPGDASKDISILIHSVQEITKHHSQHNYKQPIRTRLWQRLNAWFPFLRHKKPNLGYTAAIWRRAALSVYRPIGDLHSLLVSPPVQTCTPVEKNDYKGDNGVVCINLPYANFGYFNLHGLPDTSEWYGQRDPTDPSEGVDYPVALRTIDIENGNHSPNIVFTEACYGAHIINKNVEHAMSLKLFSSGSQAVVGSTCISYGSVSTPLIAADLLGHAFWRHLENGMPCGEALRRSKIHLASEMNKRQGFLDGEDQKTLISFILYGDPLAFPIDLPRLSKSVIRSTYSPNELKTVCSRIPEHEPLPTVAPEVMAHVKSMVAKYLPGMSDARINISQEHTYCQGSCKNCPTGILCPTAAISAKSIPNFRSDRKVIIMDKTFHKNDLTHRQYARLTIDPRGKVIKFAVSR